MSTRGARTAGVAAALAVLAAAAGCGSDDKGEPIPADARVEFEKQLSSIEDRFEFGGGACADISQNQASVEQTLDSLPDDVDAEVRDALGDGFARLFELTGEQCDETKGQETETETTEEPPPDTTPEPTPTTPTQTEQQPEEGGDEGGGGNDKGKGKGKGNGNGGGGALGLPPGGESGGAAPGDDG